MTDHNTVSLILMIYTLGITILQINIHISLIVSVVSLSGGFFTMKHKVREGWAWLFFTEMHKVQSFKSLWQDRMISLISLSFTISDTD